ncbi:MAG: hypothetical protein LBD23_06095, partial [Oscillospiraceae bacterium]|nr:hypothetical protein [Oscillospiraceae bacterium]
WRNNSIGHGALQSNLESDKKHISDFSAMLTAIAKHFEKNEYLYKQIETLDDGGGILQGRACEMELGDSIQMRIGQTVYDQSPFILVKDKTTNIIDSGDRYAVYVLNYVTGSREKQRDLLGVFEQKRISEKIEALEGSKLTSDAFVRSEIESLGRMADEKEAFINPEYITKDIKAFLEREKGVLFLQMERGMGKTTLVRALDQLAMGTLSLEDDIAVRAYYINNTYSYQINRFQDKTVTTLRDASNFIGSVLDYMNINTNFTANIPKEDISPAFAQLLNNMLRLYKEQTPVNSLVYIIDGLDEIRFDERADVSIFDCIPSSEFLDDGVYIIVTGRHQNEISRTAKEGYDRLSSEIADDTKIYSRDNAFNKDILFSYLAKQLYKNNIPDRESDVIETIIEKGDHRFVYVKALREMLRDATFDLNTVNERNIITRYLDLIKSKYGGGKHFDRLSRLLLITALLNEPATINELSYLLNFEMPDLQFLGYLNDIKGLLHIDRTGSGEKLSSNIGAMHDSWKGHLISENKDKTEDIIYDWVIALENNAFSYADNDNTLPADVADGESYLAAFLYGLIDAHTPELKGDLMDAFTDGDVKSYIMALSIHAIADLTIANAARAVMIESSHIDILEDELKQTEDEDDYDEKSNLLAAIYTNRGSIRNVSGYFDDAVSDYDKAIYILDRLFNSGKLIGSLFNENELARAYKTRGDAYASKGIYNKALADFNECIKIFTKLKRADKLEDEGDLATALMYRGCAYNQLGEHKKALNDHNSCYKILARLYDENEPDQKYRFVSVYINRGSSYTILKQNKKALADFNSAIELIEDLRKDETSSSSADDSKSEAIAYLNRGNLHSNNKSFDDAINDFTECIKLLDELRRANRLLDEQSLAKAYTNRGNIYRKQKVYQEATDDFVYSISLLEEMQKNNRQFDDNELAMAYSAMALLYLETSNYQDAITYYMNSLRLVKSIFKDRPAAQESYFFDILSVMELIYEHEDDYNALIKVSDVFEEFIYPIQDFEMTDVAQERLSKIRNLFSDSFAENLKYGIKKILDENEIADAYRERGLQYCNSGDYQEAIDDNIKCITISMRLRDEERLSSEYNLAIAYYNLGLSYQYVGKYEDSIETRTEALRILKGLFAKQPDMQAVYFEDLYALTQLIYDTEEDDEKGYAKVVALCDEFLYPMEDLDKTEEAMEVINKYFIQ